MIDGGGGSNTVIYGRPSGNYSVIRLMDGSILVASRATPEGPDRLTNIQKLQFADKAIDAASKRLFLLQRSKTTRTTVVVANLVGPGHIEITVTARSSWRAIFYSIQKKKSGKVAESSHRLTRQSRSGFEWTHYGNVIDRINKTSEAGLAALLG